MTTDLYLVHDCDYDSSWQDAHVVRASSYDEARRMADASEYAVVHKLLDDGKLGPIEAVEDPVLLEKRRAEHQAWLDAAPEREAAAKAANEAAQWITEVQLGPDGKPTGKTRRRRKGDPDDPSAWV